MIVILLFVIAVFCMVFGHICKVHRWGLLISVYEKPSESNLLNAMTTGHTMNTLLPIRIGDIVRILWAGRKLKNGISLSAATVAVDLYVDVVTVGLMFFGLSVIGKGGTNLQQMAKIYMIIFLIIIPLSIFAILCRKLIKKAVKAIASIFNSKIEYRILYITYLCIASLKDIFLKIDKLKFIILTLGIWTGYVTSYVVFAEAIQKYGIYYATSDVFTELFSGASIYHVPQAALPMWIAYLLLPLAICAILSMVVHRKEKAVKVFRKTLPQMNERDKLAFLQTYYMEENRENIQSYLDINQDVVIVEDKSAGSNASTVVVQKKTGKLFFRKYAFNEDGMKLQEQIEWIEEHQSDIPLPVISDKQQAANYVAYDMPNYSGAVGLFRYIHTMPAENSYRILEQALTDIKSNLHEKNKRMADEEAIDRYIESKVVKNLNIINENSKYIKSLEQFSEIIVNGSVLPTLKHYRTMFDREHLKNIWGGDCLADIHGDLTIENIVCLSDHSDINITDYQGKILPQDYYFIDPNTGNVHDSPFLDYGKLLQSLHGNYEFLMMVHDVQIDGNHVSFMMTKSENYGKIYKRFRQYLLEHFSDRDVLSIYYHEVVHWLRLMPYKIRKNEKLAVVFYTGLLTVLKDVWEMEHAEKEKVGDF